MEKKLLNQKEFANYIGVSVNTVRSWIEKGMPIMKHDKIIRVDIDDAKEWLREKSNDNTRLE